MDLIPVWRQPIPVRVSLGTGKDDPFDWVDAYTYGLIATELLEAEERLPDRLGEQAISGAVSALGSVQQTDPMSRLREEAQLRLAPFVAPLREAAGTGRATKVPEHDLRPIRELLARPPYTPPYEPRPLFAGGKQRWGLQFSTLLDRAAAEIFELYVARPRIRRCVFCDAVYVPRESEANCRWNKWKWPSRVGDAPLERCAPDAVIDAYEAAQRERDADSDLQHKRMKKKLNARWRRELKRQHGDGDHQLVRFHHQEYKNYMARKGRPRGRRRKVDFTS